MRNGYESAASNAKGLAILVGALSYNSDYPESAHPTIPTEVLSKAQVVAVDREFAFA